MISLNVRGRTLWTAFPKQEEILVRPEFEVLAGGARGGGKTAAGIMKMIAGNATMGIKTGTVADEGYFMHPGYRGLVLRRNVSDMGSWIAQAKRIYQPLGGEYTQRPAQFEFKKSGAVIVIGHLADADAYEHFQGQEYSRILIEELTQIPSEELYVRVMASCRSPYKDLRPQMIASANPGGPGHHWVKTRFIDVAEPGQPYTDQQTGLTRIFIPAKVSDNPVYANDAQYLGQLMSLPPALRRAWLDGDWDSLGGQMFSEFRLKPGIGEPACAQHVIDSRDSIAHLDPWWFRWAALDWGYGHRSVVYFGAQAPNGQIHVYREISVNQTTPEELGVLIAQAWAEDLRSGCQRHLQLFLPSDALAKKTSERTIGDMIATGIAKILGDGSSLVLADDNLDAGLADLELRQQGGIAILRVQNHRVAGWMQLHHMLRWWPLLDSAPQFDPLEALRLYQTDRAEWMRYQEALKQPTEALPRLLIHGDKCPRLIKAIPEAVAQSPDDGDPNDVVKQHWNGADEVDSLRYLCFSHQFIRNSEPLEVFVSKHFEKYASNGLSGLSGDSRVQIARKAEELWNKQHGGFSQPLKWPSRRPGRKAA